MVYKVLGSIFQFFHWDNFYEDDTNGNDVDDSQQAFAQPESQFSIFSFVDGDRHDEKDR